jgi:hypothetical protein
MQFLRRQVVNIEYLRRDALAFHLADEILMRVVVELGDDAEDRRSRRELQRSSFLDEALALPQKGERRLAVVEARLGAFEKIELAIAIQIDPQRHSCAAEGIDDSHRRCDILELRSSIHEQSFRLLSEPQHRARQLDEIEALAVVDVGPRGAMLVAAKILVVEVLPRDVFETPIAEVSKQLSLVEVVRHIQVRQAVAIEVTPCDTVRSSVISTESGCFRHVFEDPDWRRGLRAARADHGDCADDQQQRDRKRPGRPVAKRRAQRRRQTSIHSLSTTSGRSSSYTHLANG